MNRSAITTWIGSGKDGSGTLTCDSGALQNSPYSSRSRFVETTPPTGANPEELLAAAHAASFTMSLASRLSDAGHTPLSIQTEARVQVIKPATHWSIPSIRLHTTVTAPGLSAAELMKLAHEARGHDPITQALKADVSLTATLAERAV
ncbi:MAG TPA: OsmC family peroxiredoxin [Kofleriaceae bacterium]|nr:OsmC family peroxiredoxin [Kofleriaceae bacterium]